LRTTEAAASSTPGRRCVDLAPLFGLHRLRDLRMASRRNYTPSLAEVKRQLGLEA
jgi:hypothetical protein